LKIAVFGDSYAEKNSSQHAWWQRLCLDHGHVVTCYGTGGSSIKYSMDLLEKHHSKFDFNIWCVTTPARISVANGNDFFHSSYNSLQSAELDLAFDNQEVVDACKKYFKYIFSWDYENFLGKIIVEHYLRTVPNLMIIPCFPAPLESFFNLYDLCYHEIKLFFPKQRLEDIFKSHKDLRQCHLTVKNNEILAKLISDNLVPGIFQTKFENFEFSNLNKNQLLKAL